MNLYKQTIQMRCFEFQIPTHLKHARQELCDKKSTCLFFVMSVLIFTISHLDYSTHSVLTAAAVAATAYWVKWDSVRVPMSIASFQSFKNESMRMAKVFVNRYFSSFALIRLCFVFNRFVCLCFVTLLMSLLLALFPHAGFCLLTISPKISDLWIHCMT